MELLQMKYFYDTAENGSFTQTAKKYMVPTSSVSAAVKRLEKELCCELFDRSANKIVLNDAGKRFKASLDVIFDELDTVKTEINSETSQTAIIKILAKTIRHKVVRAMSRYHKLHPKIRFNAVCELARNDYENFDMIVDTDMVEYPGYDKYVLDTYPVYLRCNTDSKYATGKYRLLDLKNESFISFGEHSNLHKSLVNACKKAGFVPNIVMSTDDSECYRILRREFEGISASRSGKKFLETTVRIDVTDFKESHTVCLYCSKNTDKNIAKSFGEFLRKTY